MDNILYYHMYWLCTRMIATIPFATGNKLNCFISARGMLAIVWHCVLLFCCFFVCFFVDFYMLISHLLKKKQKKMVLHLHNLFLPIPYSGRLLYTVLVLINLN